MADPEVGLPFCRDSPYLQRALLDQEEYVRVLGKYLGDVAKEMRSFNKGLIISINSAVSLAEKMKGAQNIRRVGEDAGGITSSGIVQLEPVLARFSEVLFEIAGAQEILAESLETSFIQPVEKFFKVEVPKVADLRKKLNSATEAHDLALGRFLRPPHHHRDHGNRRESSPPRRRLLGLLRPGNNNNVDRDSRASMNGGGGGEVEHVDKRSSDLATALREAELCRFNLTFKLNELEARTTFELSECIVTALYSYRACFHQQLDTVKTLQPFMDDLQSTQNKMRESYQSAKAPWEVRRQLLNEVFYTMGDSSGNDGDAEGVNEDKEWLADTQARIAKLYTADSVKGFDWSSKMQKTKKKKSHQQQSSSASSHGEEIEGKQYDQAKLASRKVLKSGYLFLKSTGRLGRAIWHRRWFELDEEYLSYIKGSDGVDEPPIVVCELMLATVRDIPAYNAEDSAGFSFEIFSANRHSLMLQASGSEDLNSWTTALRNCIEANLCLQQSSPPPPPHHSPHITSSNVKYKDTGEDNNNNNNNGHEGGSGGGGGGGIPADLLLWEGSGNEVCADCRSKQPEWVSINLGVFLCIECSGIHRSLGTHISKVRSTTLDSLNPETISLLRALGNTRANSVWEHSVQEGWFKPEEKDDRPTKEQWIRSKYTFRGFAPYDPELSDKQAKDLAEKHLHEAAQSGDVVAALSALARGADPNCMTKYPLEDVPETNPELTDCKASPLHTAAAYGHGDVVEFLLQNGADCMATTMPFIRSRTTSDDIGPTPLQLATKCGHTGIAGSLQAWMTKSNK